MQAASSARRACSVAAGGRGFTFFGWGGRRRRESNAYSKNLLGQENIVGLGFALRKSWEGAIQLFPRLLLPAPSDCPASARPQAHRPPRRRRLQQHGLCRISAALLCVAVLRLVCYLLGPRSHQDDQARFSCPHREVVSDHAFHEPLEPGGRMEPVTPGLLRLVGLMQKAEPIVSQLPPPHSGLPHQQAHHR